MKCVKFWKRGKIKVCGVRLKKKECLSLDEEGT
jgi:hypothetical protein